MTYQKNVCHECGQTTDYLMRLDKGSTLILIAVVQAMKRLGKPRVHLHKDMAHTNPSEFGGYVGMVKAGYLTLRMICNATKACNFGLISAADSSGRYNVTERGMAFLRGEPIESWVIIDKATHRPKEMQDFKPKMVTIQGILRGTVPFWDVDGVPTV